MKSRVGSLLVLGGQVRLPLPLLRSRLPHHQSCHSAAGATQKTLIIPAAGATAALTFPAAGATQRRYSSSGPAPTGRSHTQTHPRLCEPLGGTRPFAITTSARSSSMATSSAAAAAAAADAGAGAWPAVKVRKTFLEYFEKNGHRFVPSSSVVPHSDPTLLFANAGMNQYKSIFLGTVDPNSDFATLKRAVNSQKCIRAGGKHNDLDDVGKDSYHHTFFEMLGNWSFGDYFKEGAIRFSWDLLTKVYGLDPDRLYVTYFEGDKANGLEPDLEARDFWKAVGVKDDHILTGDAKDNFWEMGDQGPCGPCSEVHYDRIGGRNAASLVNKDDPNVIEIWNNVFIQYNREPDKSLRPLPAKHVDTGLGYERLVSILQDKPSNYDTDVFTPLFDTIAQITGARSYAGRFGKDDPDGIDTAYRVVADHVRTLSFAIADGAAPNNDGRGYVVRRVLRRGARYARKYLNVEIGNFFSRIVPTLVKQMGDMFPELKKKEDDIKEILDEEEQSFAKTLDRGERQFEHYAQEAKVKGVNKLHGADVWKLYDTYGFPVDLTQIMAEERGLSIDESEFEQAKAAAREASKGEKKAASGLLKLDVHDIGALSTMPGLQKTDDSPKYGRENITALVKAIYYEKAFHNSTDGIGKGEQVGVILDRTCFYAEQGGQEFDTGVIIIDGSAELKVENVQVYAGFVLHTGYLVDGNLKVGDEVICEYDELRRWPIRNNHTGTHILNYALREILGDGVDQKGSLVAQEKLRFDFSNKSGISDPDLEKIENICTDYIRQNSEVYSKDVPLATAQQIQGVRAVFGETYPDPVRVVSVGVPVDDILSNVKNADWEKVSIEFCGGTHVTKTGEIKELVILEENGIAKGIRRIVAVTGHDAHEVQRVAKEFEKRLAAVEKLAHGPERDAEIKSIKNDLPQLVISAVTKAKFNARFTKVQQAQLEAQKAQQKAEAKIALEEVKKYFESNKDKKFAVLKLPIGANAKSLTEVQNHFSKKDKDKTVYVFGVDEAEGKVAHACYMADAVSKQGGTSALELAKVVSDIVGGRAGGKGATSTGSGTKPDRVDEAVEAATKYLEKLSL